MTKTYCARCRVTFTIIAIFEPLEPWEQHTPADACDEMLTTCPKCGGETTVLEIDTDVRAAIEQNRELDT